MTMARRTTITAAAVLWAWSALPAPAMAADGPPRMDKIDFARLSCADALQLKAADAPRYLEAAQWLAGWLAEPKVYNDVSLPAIAKAAETWAAACAAKPEAKLKSVAKPALDKKTSIPLSALKCQEFLELDAANHDAALALVRWMDGWNARALGETTANFYYHKKHMQSAMDGCMKYPRRVLMYVVAGKYR